MFEVPFPFGPVFFVLWRILDSSVVAFPLFPFTVAHGCLSCFPFARLLLTMGVLSFTLVSLDASCFSSCAFHGALLLMLHLSACFGWCFPMPFPLAHRHSCFELVG